MLMCQSEKRYGGHGSGRLCGVFHLYNPTFCNTRHSDFSQIVQPLLTFSDISSCFLSVLFQEMLFVQSYKVNLGKLKVVSSVGNPQLSLFFSYSQSISVCVCARSCPIPWDPMDCSLQGSSIHVIFQARTLEWVAVSYYSGSS